MAKFEVYGQGKDSGRKRKRVYTCIDEQEARRRAETDGITVEETKLLPGDPPTEKQLEYAKDLKIDIPPGATKDDLIDLISLAVEKDKPSTERHRAFARRYMVEVTNYIGKRELFDRILFALTKPGREKELTAWFAYRVYREIVGGADNAPIDGPDHPVIQEVAAQLQLEDSVIKSISRYEGRDLIWFGEYTAPSGSFHTGGSNKTIAYKRASALLRERITISPHSKDRSATDGNPLSSKPYRSQTSATKRSGCLSIVVLAGIIVLCAIISITVFVTYS